MDQGDERHLRRAIELAASARAAGDRPYGSLLVGPDGAVLKEDMNTVYTGRDITAHPELKLARWAARELDETVAGGTTMYTSCHPCPMCAAAIERSGLGRVVFALSSEQRDSLKPDDPATGGRRVSYDGPALLDEARIPVEGYYD